MHSQVWGLLTQSMLLPWEPRWVNSKLTQQMTSQNPILSFGNQATRP